MTEYTLEQCLEQQKKVDASIKHNGEYMPWLAGIKEVIEMCDHLSMIDTWKKQPEPDMKQAFMELVDVFAFAMSGINLKEYRSMVVLKDNYTDKNFGKFCRYVALKRNVDMLIWACCEKKPVSALTSICSLCNDFFDRPINDIFYYYMGKQTLTRFRQKNGYPEGTYVKKWGGREDNEFLTDALEQGIEIDAVYEHLKANYERLVIAKAEVG